MRDSWRPAALPGWAWGLVVLQVTAAAFAQDVPERTSTNLGELVVTATKREERLQDVPIAVSAIGSEELVARGISSFADYLNSVPGVFFQESAPGVGAIRIRGLSAAEGGIPSTVATYFGETITSVQTNNGGKYDIRLIDVERVEVLRGPQGTLFGANALAGVVRTIPAPPDLSGFDASFGTRGFTMAHSDDKSYHVEGVLNFALVPDRFAVRIVGYKDEVAGYVDDVFAGQDAIDYSVIGDILLGQDPGTLPAGTLVNPAVPAFTKEDINSEDTVGGRIAAAWEVSDRFRVDIGLMRQEVTLEGPPFVGEGAGDYGVVRAMDAFDPGEFSGDLDLGSLVFTYTGDRVALVSATGYTKLERSDFQDITPLAAASFGVPVLWGLAQVTDGEMFQEEIRLESTGAGPFNWIVGAFYFDHDMTFTQTVPDFSCPACLPTFLFGQDFAFRGSGGSTDEQRALFGEITWDFSDRWSAGVGARYLEQDLSIETHGIEGLLAGGVGDTSASADASEFNPSFSLRFRPSEDVTLYAQAARGFRGGVANQQLPAQCQAEAAEVGLGPLSEPDTAWNYELGLKTVLADGRVSLNSAIYQTDWTGVQLPASLDCGFSGVMNGGDVTGRGVELEIVAQPTEVWRFNFSGSYNDNEFDEVQPATGFENGGRLPGSYEKNFSAGAQYDFELGPAWSGFVRADYTYVGDVLVFFRGSPEITQDAYGTTNLRLGFARGGLALELFGRNLADKRAVVVTGDPAFGMQQVLNRPREVGIELRYDYR